MTELSLGLTTLLASSRGTGRYFRRACVVRFFFLALILASPGLVVPVSAEDATSARNSVPRVLLLYSNDRLLPANLRFDEGFRDALGQALGERYDLYTEFLDAVRFPEEARQEAMAASLRVRYQKRPPQVLVAAGTEALTFFQKRRDSLFPGTPLLFGGIRLPDETAGALGPEVAGVPMSLDIASTLDLALRLRPQTREVVVISGSANIDRDWDTVARRDFRPFESRVKVTFWNELPFAELIRRAGALPPETVVFYLTYFKEPNGTRMRSSAHALERLAAKCAAPIFGPYDTYIGKGIVGGMMTDFAGEGAAVARLVQRILAGETAQQIGIQPPRPGIFQFDARQLKRWKIPTRLLPPGSVVSFREPTLWEEHRGFIIGVAAIVALQAALIAGLLAQRGWRRRSEGEVRSLRQELTHAGRVSMLGQLSTALAHELNQPLGAILRNAEAAELFLQQEQPDLDELREIVADIRKDDQRAGSVIDRLSGLLKRRELQLRPVDLGELMDDVHMLLHVDQARRHVDVTLDFPKTLPLVLADRVHLQQVLLNLKINALDALSEENGEPKMIAVRARAVDSRMVEITVEDNGPGIPPEKMEHLFEPFFTTKGHGLGFGLSICRTIIEAHRGKLTAANREPHGAVFRITLPIEKGVPS